MVDFMTHELTVEKIELACLVRSGKGGPVHKNRKSHGLAIFLGGERTFSFDSKKLTVEKNTIVYFPKGSNYTIHEKQSSDCYAINFQLSEPVAFEPFAFKIKNFSSVLECFITAQKIWKKKNPGHTTKVKSELYNILYHMQAEYSLPYSNSHTIQPAVDYIHAHYDKEDISISGLNRPFA